MCNSTPTYHLPLEPLRHQGLSATATSNIATHLKANIPGFITLPNKKKCCGWTLECYIDFGYGILGVLICFSLSAILFAHAQAAAHPHPGDLQSELSVAVV